MFERTEKCDVLMFFLNIEYSLILYVSVDGLKFGISTKQRGRGVISEMLIVALQKGIGVRKIIILM